MRILTALLLAALAAACVAPEAHAQYSRQAMMPQGAVVNPYQQPANGIPPGYVPPGYQPIAYAQPAYGVPMAVQPVPQLPPVGTPARQASTQRTTAAASNRLSDALASSVGLEETAHGAPCNSCNSGACDSCNTCQPCCPASNCCGGCLHQSGVFADFLYLQARNVDLAWGVPQDGVGPPSTGTAPGPVPVGGVGVLNFDNAPAFRIGFNAALDCTSSVTAAYTYYDADTTNALNVGGTFVLQPLVMFPGTFNAGSTAQYGEAFDEIKFQTADLDYRSVIASCNRYCINYLVGVRYAQMDQGFGAIFNFAPPDGVTAVIADVNMRGLGLRFGIDGSRVVMQGHGLQVYGKAVGSLLASEVSSAYLQANQFNGVEVNTSWSEDRVIPILETEVGLGWASQSGALRLSVGYTFAAWANMITMPAYIDAVQNGNYATAPTDARDTVTFDGLVSRVQFSF